MASGPGQFSQPPSGGMIPPQFNPRASSNLPGGPPPFVSLPYSKPPSFAPPPPGLQSFSPPKGIFPFGPNKQASPALSAVPAPDLSGCLQNNCMGLPQVSPPEMGLPPILQPELIAPAQNQPPMMQPNPQGFGWQGQSPPNPGFQGPPTMPLGTGSFGNFQVNFPLIVPGMMQPGQGQYPPPVQQGQGPPPNQRPFGMPKIGSGMMQQSQGPMMNFKPPEQSSPPPMTRLLPLISFARDLSPASNSDPNYTAQVIEPTVQTLSANFSAVPVCHYFFVYGSVYKNSILGALLGQARPDIEKPELCFQCGEFAVNGVFVWPEPIQIGEVVFLLIKMRRPIDSSKERYMELRRKVVRVLAQLSSVCCLSEEPSKVLDAIDSFTQDYFPISQRLHLDVCRLHVFMMKSWFTRANEKAALEQRLNAHKSLLLRVLRDENGIEDSWLPSLATLQTDRFSARHFPFWAETSYVPRFLHWTTTFLKLANLNLTFPAFVSKLPDTALPEAEERLASTLEDLTRTEAACEETSALPFLTRVETAGQVSVTFDSAVSERIQQTYDVTKPTVVLVLLGEPGIGKSTLLNHIVKFITEKFKLPSVFKVGNSTSHTTRGSQVLSYPLVYKGHQIMLADIEGLEGAETKDPKEEILQHNLVSGVLTVASVPCLLVRNSIESIRFVEKYVKKIFEKQVDFAFRTERIFLLIRDIDQPTEVPIPQFREQVQHLNRTYFQNRPVIQILNKPNFSHATTYAQQQSFLQTLLDNSLYPKKTISDVHVTFPELLTKIRVIATNETKKLSGLFPTPLDREMQVAYIVWKKLEIKALQQKVKSRDGRQLFTYFNEMVGAEFDLSTAGELGKLSQSIREECRVVIESELDRVRAEMIEIEACSGFVRENPQTKENVVHLAQYLKSAFISKVHTLTAKLELVRTYFPTKSTQIASLLEVVKTASTKEVAPQTAPPGWVVAKGLSPEAENLSGGICSAMVLEQKAVQLVWVNSLYGNGKVNEEMLKAEEPNKETPVLLLVGSQRTSVSEFANALVRHIAPFTSAYFQAFNSSWYTQILAFDYFHPNLRGTLARSYLICLRVEEQSSNLNNAMLKIVEMLVPVASVAYLLVDNSSYAESLIKAVCPPLSPDQTAQPEMKTRVRVLHTEKVDKEPLIRALARRNVNYGVGPLKLGKESIQVEVAAIKRELDQSSVQPFNKFKGQIDALPRALEPFRL